MTDRFGLAHRQKVQDVNAGKLSDAPSSTATKTSIGIQGGTRTNEVRGPDGGKILAQQLLAAGGMLGQEMSKRNSDKRARQGVLMSQSEEGRTKLAEWRNSWQDKIFGPRVEVRAAEKRIVENSLAQVSNSLTMQLRDDAFKLDDDKWLELKTKTIDNMADKYKDDPEMQEVILASMTKYLPAVESARSQLHGAYVDMTARQTMSDGVRTSLNTLQIAQDIQNPDVLGMARDGIIGALQQHPDMTDSAYSDFLMSEAKRSLAEGDGSLFDIMEEEGLLSNLKVSEQDELSDQMAELKVSEQDRQDDLSDQLADLEDMRALRAQQADQKNAALLEQIEYAKSQGDLVALAAAQQELASTSPELWAETNKDNGLSDVSAAMAVDRANRENRQHITKGGELYASGNFGDFVGTLKEKKEAAQTGMLKHAQGKINEQKMNSFDQDGNWTGERIRNDEAAQRAYILANPKEFIPMYVKGEQEIGMITDMLKELGEMSQSPAAWKDPQFAARGQELIRFGLELEKTKSKAWNQSVASSGSLEFISQWKRMANAQNPAEVAQESAEYRQRLAVAREQGRGKDPLDGEEAADVINEGKHELLTVFGPFNDHYPTNEDEVGSRYLNLVNDHFTKFGNLDQAKVYALHKMSTEEGMVGTRWQQDKGKLDGMIEAVVPGQDLRALDRMIVGDIGVRAYIEEQTKRDFPANLKDIGYSWNNYTGTISMLAHGADGSTSVISIDPKEVPRLFAKSSLANATFGYSKDKSFLQNFADGTLATGAVGMGGMAPNLQPGGSGEETGARAQSTKRKPPPPSTELAREHPESVQIREDEGVSMNDIGQHISYAATEKEKKDGKVTGGYGHRMTPAEAAAYPYGTPIPQEVVDDWYRVDLNEAKHDAEVFLKDVDPATLPYEVLSIVQNMAFNMGLPTLMEFEDFQTAIIAGDYEEAANQMVASNWYGQVKDRSKRLVERMRELARQAP